MAIIKDKVTLNRVWESGMEVPNYDPDRYRKDACGAWIIKDQYMKRSPFGWGVDQISPFADKGALENMRPMNISNIKSKSNSYPRYRAVVTSNGQKNIRCSKLFLVSSKKQAELEALALNEQVVAVVKK